MSVFCELWVLYASYILKLFAYHDQYVFEQNSSSLY